MKHTLKVTLILLCMFFIAQMIGIFVASSYAPVQIEGTNQTTHNIPYGLEPPADVTPGISVVSIMIALVIAVFLMFILMKIKAEIFLRIWFFAVVSLGIALALNAFLIKIPNSYLIALAIAVPLAAVKIFQRNLIIHNITELLIYPGIASVFIPILNIWSVILLLILISFYDIYAVWHAGFMQKMAKYQIEKLRVFSGFFIPYLGRKEKAAIKKAKEFKLKTGQDKKVGVNIAILGGGDVVFPIILAGVVLPTFGILSAIIVSIGATAALAALFYYSEKGKFYPAMPFITAGCLVALGIVYLFF